MVGVPPMVAVAVVLCGPITGPRVRVVEARPLASVNDVAGFTEPPPTAFQLTLTPATPLLNPSATLTTCGVPRVVPAIPIRLSPDCLTRVAGGPTCPVAVKVTGLPSSPLELASTELEPGVVASVH